MVTMFVFSQYKNTSEAEDSQGSEYKVSETEADDTGKLLE